MAIVFRSKQIQHLLKAMDLSHLGEDVAIKVHFGEKRCDTHVRPELVKAVYDAVVNTGRTAALVECNVLYRGSRTNREDHIKTARDHGFTFAPIDILDGARGEESITVGTAKLGAGLKKYDSMIVITHFKGHMMAGYGGALKNIGMGLGSRAGKFDMHCSVRPSVVEKKCTGCGTCAQNCDVKAIRVSGGTAKIDPDACVGCAMCIAVCPTGAVTIPWGSSNSEQVIKKIVDYAKAVMTVIPKKRMLFINVLEKITKDCDCMNTKQEPIITDIGLLLSDDPVSIDQASLELIDPASGGRFSQLHGVDTRLSTRYAQEQGLGEAGYTLVDV